LIYIQLSVLGQAICLIFKMRPLNIVVIFALTLLLSQTAIAVHDVHCLDGDHDQSCEIFLTQDHNADNNTVQNQLEAVEYDERPHGFNSLVSSTLLSSLYLPRAPPHSHF